MTRLRSRLSPAPDPPTPGPMASGWAEARNGTVLHYFVEGAELAACRRATRDGRVLPSLESQWRRRCSVCMGRAEVRKRESGNATA